MLLRIVSVLAAVAVCALCVRRLALLLAALARPKRIAHVPSAELPMLTLLVPAHNEQTTSDELLASVARLDYPPERLFVVLISDGSTDGTAERFATWTRNRPHARVVVEERRVGKAGALNRGLALCSTELVAVCDADLRPREQSLRRLAAAFRDQTVGAAAAMLHPDNATQSPIARYAAVETWVHQIITSAGRDRLDANPPALGASMYRRAALEQVGFFPEGIEGGVDVAVSVALTRAGWRTRFIPDAIVDNRVVYRLADYWHQHIRWFRGSISTASGSRAARTVPLARRLEAWMLSASYTDRLAFLASVVLARGGELTMWAPVAYVAIRGLEVLAALAKARVAAQAPIFLGWAAVFFFVDIVVSLAGATLHLARRPPRWRSPARVPAGGAERAATTRRHEPRCPGG